MLAPAVQWRKEVRELLPWWAVTVVMMAACWLLMHPDALPRDSIYSWATDRVYTWLVVNDRNSLLGIGLVAYATGAVTLGALSLGHEYSHDTLAQLLAQPIARAQVLQVKLLVLAAMLLPLGLLAVGAWGFERALVGLLPWPLLLVPVAGGLFVAPWLTMIGRGPLAGVVFTAALFSAAAVGTSYRPPSPGFWLAIVTLVAAGATLTWRTFLRLQATGGTHGEVDFAAWITGSPEDAQAKAGQNWSWLLVKKELRLQQATFVVSGLFLAAWSIVFGRKWLGLSGTAETPLLVATFLNACLVPLLAGAMTSAEERRLAVAQWQTLLPAAASKQWVIKSGVAVGITFVLAGFLPAHLAGIAGEPSMREIPGTLAVVIFCVTAIYISSISSSGLRAFLVTGPVVTVSMLLVPLVLWPIVRGAHPAVHWLAYALPVVPFPDWAWRSWSQYELGVASGGLALILLRFGHLNHRLADRSRVRIAAQLAWISVYVCASWIFVTFVEHLIQHRFYAR
jgi:hypothetical protein